jgi:hypothetical protein
MAEEQQRLRQVEALMAQDPQIDESKLKEFRMQLQQNLADWERRGARLRRIVVIAFLTYLAFGLLTILVRSTAQPGYDYPLPIRAIAAIVAWTALIAGGYAIIAYFVKFAPAIRRLRYDIQNAMITELQQQVVALRDELRTRPPGGHTHGNDPHSS